MSASLSRLCVSTSASVSRLYVSTSCVDVAVYMLEPFEAEWCGSVSAC
jgi:hypothetical protein